MLGRCGTSAGGAINPRLCIAMALRFHRLLKSIKVDGQGPLHVVFSGSRSNGDGVNTILSLALRAGRHVALGQAGGCPMQLCPSGREAALWDLRARGGPFRHTIAKRA